MSTNDKTKFLSALIFFALIASAIFPIPARADSGSPPPVEPTTTGQSSDSTSTASNVTQVPVVVPNPGGRGNGDHKVKLNSQKAAYVTEVGDPVWCPSSMGAPTPGAGACTTNYGDMASLVAYLSSNQKTVDGTIWINGGGPDSSGPNTMSGGAAFATMAAHKLTFKGGWTGIGGTINTVAPSVFSNSLNIIDWGRDITLSDVQFNSVPSIYGRGLFITTNGNLTLTRVQANNDDRGGAYLDNTSGTGVVTISNSHFDSDAITYNSNSLEILSHNAITLTNVSVNSGKGAYIDNSTATNKPVTIKTGSFDSNGNHGLVVYSKGAITLTDVSASWNVNIIKNADGAYLDNHCASGCSAPVILTGSNVFSGNTFSGLYIFSNGAIKVNQITANSNGNADGAYLENDYAGSTGGTTLTGSNIFDNNDYTGLKIMSNGPILLSSIEASSNITGGGVYLNNSSAVTAMPVTLAGNYTFDSNYLDGLYIGSSGAIKLNSIISTHSAAGDGVYVNNSTSLTPQSVTITGLNSLNYNSYNGLEILTKGAIKAGDLTAVRNGLSNAPSLSGVFFENDFPGAVGGVTLTGTSFFINNFGYGLNIKSNGAVTLYNLVADGNHLDGVEVDNSLASTSQPVTVTSTSEFISNWSIGLFITTKGAVSLKNITATANHEGLNVVDTAGGTNAPKPFTLTGYGIFNLNGMTGVSVITYGAISTNNLTAYRNGNSCCSGVTLNNSGALIPASVTLNGINKFSDNGYWGLYVQSKGAIKANSITANNSFGDGGASLNNSYSGSIGGVTLTGTNVFSGNGYEGLVILSRGTVSLKNITSNSSIHSSGLIVDNTYGGTDSPKSVSISGMNEFIGNSMDGVNIKTFGAITLSNITAEENRVYLDNHNALFPAKVTITGVNNFNYTDYGLEIQSLGAVTLTRITYEYNLLGLLIETSGTISVTCGKFIQNGGTSLELSSPTTMLLVGVYFKNNTTDLSVTGGGTLHTVPSCPLP